MKARYVIKHHPGLFTAILCELNDGSKPQQIEDRYSWAVAREYCRQSLEQRGVVPTIERPDCYTEVFPWVELN